MNTPFVFGWYAEAIEDLPTAAGSPKSGSDREAGGCSWIHEKRKWARLNLQDVGAHETETLFVPFDWAKQPEDLAHFS